MFSIRRDFGFAGKIFGVQRAILSRICAFCSSWSVEGNIIKLSIPEFPDPTKNPIKLSIDEDALREAVGGGSGSVNSVDGHSPDENGAVSFGLTSCRVVTTDSNGHLTSASALTADRHVVTDANGNLSTLSSSGVTSASGGGLEVVTAVTWNASSHKLTITKRKLVFEKGIVKTIESATNADVDVATLITWA